jgi:hypothetical protein
MLQLIRVSAIEIDAVWRERDRGIFLKKGIFWDACDEKGD